MIQGAEYPKCLYFGRILKIWFSNRCFQYYKIRKIQRTFSRATSHTILGNLFELVLISGYNQQVLCKYFWCYTLGKMFVVFSEFCNIENIDSRIKSSKFFQNTSNLDIQRPCIITLNAHFVWILMLNSLFF